MVKLSEPFTEISHTLQTTIFAPWILSLQEKPKEHSGEHKYLPVKLPNDFNNPYMKWQKRLSMKDNTNLVF